jgi:hypothetical protein
MIRYRCPHCAALLAAHERRAGQSSVCKACLKPHPIPADPSLWLADSGEALRPVEPAAPAPTRAPTPAFEPALAEGSPPSLTEFHLPEPALAPASPREPVPVAARAAAEPGGEMAAESDSGAVATMTPPRGAVPAPPARPAPPLAVVASEPVRAQTQADIAVALTAALAARMKPPPAPRRDLRPSTALWLVTTGAAVALLLVSMFTSADFLLPALLLGAAQVLAGYAWIVRLAHLRDPRRGLLCAVPPLTLYYLAQYRYSRLRPLRFVLTGAALVVLCLVASPLLPKTRALVKGDERPAAPQPDPAAMSKLEQLRYFAERKDYDSLGKLLDVLAKTDPLLSEDAKDRAPLAAELRKLCEHPLTDVRVQAMAAYARWDPEGARAVCLAALRSPTYEERRMALHLLPQWKDAETARAVQSLIGRPGTVETNQAKAALEEIGGAPAEQAAIALLNRAEDQATKLTALAILEKVGGAETAASLRTYAMAADDPAVRSKAFASAAAIESRVPAPQAP